MSDKHRISETERENYRVEMQRLLLALAPLTNIKALQTPQQAMDKARQREEAAFNRSASRAEYIVNVQKDITTLSDNLSVKRQEMARQGAVQQAAAQPPLQHQYAAAPVIQPQPTQMAAKPGVHLHLQANVGTMAPNAAQASVASQQQFSHNPHQPVQSQQSIYYPRQPQVAPTGAAPVHDKTALGQPQPTAQQMQMQMNRAQYTNPSSMVGAQAQVQQRVQVQTVSAQQQASRMQAQHAQFSAQQTQYAPQQQQVAPQPTQFAPAAQPLAQPQKPTPSLDDIKQKFDDLRTVHRGLLQSTAAKAIQFQNNPPPGNNANLKELLALIIQAYEYIQHPFPTQLDPAFIEAVTRSHEVLLKQAQSRQTGRPPAQGQPTQPIARPQQYPVGPKIPPQTQQQAYVIDDGPSVPDTRASLLTNVPVKPTASTIATGVRLPVKPSASGPAAGTQPLTHATSLPTAPTATVAPAPLPAVQPTAATAAANTVAPTQLTPSAAQPPVGAAPAAATNIPPKLSVEGVSLAELVADLLKEAEKGIPPSLAVVIQADLDTALHGRLDSTDVCKLLQCVQDKNSVFWWQDPAFRESRKRSHSDMLADGIVKSEDSFHARVYDMAGSEPNAKRAKHQGFMAWSLFEEAKQKISEICASQIVFKRMIEIDDYTVAVEHSLPSDRNPHNLPRFIISFKRSDDSSAVLVDPQNPSLALLAPTFSVENVEFPGILMSALKTSVNSLHLQQQTPASIALHALEMWQQYIQALHTVSRTMQQPRFHQIRLTESEYNKTKGLVAECDSIPSLFVPLPVDYPKTGIMHLHLFMPADSDDALKTKRSIFMDSVKSELNARASLSLENLYGHWLAAFKG